MRLAASLEGQALAGQNLEGYVSVRPGTSVSATISAMNQAATPCAIVSTGTAVLGVFTDRDVLMRVVSRPRTWQEPIETVMTADPATLRRTESVAAALGLMTELRIRNVPVVDAQGGLVGNASYSTVMRVAADVLDELTAGDVSDLSTESGLLFIDFTGLIPHKPVTVEPETSMAEGMQLMRSWAVGSLLVVDNRERLVGVMTEFDVQTKLACTEFAPAKVPVREFMTDHPVTLSPRDPIASAVRRMAAHGFTHVPLVGESGRPVGMVSFRDVAEFLDTSLATLH